MIKVDHSDIAKDDVYVASLPGAGATIAKDGVYAASQPEAGAARTLFGMTIHFNGLLYIVLLSFGNFLNLIFFQQIR